MSGSHSRTKGHSFEREMAAQFREMGWSHAKTQREARGGDWQFTDHGYDLVHTEPFRIQCKRYHKYVPIERIMEVERVEGSIPVLITKADNKEAMVVLPLEEFKKLLVRIYGT